MQIRVTFYSYFKELAGCEQADFDLPPETPMHELLRLVAERFPKLQGMERSTLAAVGVEYQQRDYPLKEGDEVSLFPPVQGG
jgi:molybdopterin converting factor small subunit